jgi:ABC-type multidrug transport system ATPase subunit
MFGNHPRGTGMGIVIRTEGLSKRYGDVLALAPLDWEVSEDEVLGYLGPNGAAKTTTIRLLLGCWPWSNRGGSTRRDGLQPTRSRRRITAGTPDWSTA